MADLINRLPLTLMFFLYLGFVAWTYSEKDTDPNSPVAAKKSQIQMAKSTLEATQNKIRETDEFIRSLETKRTELQVLAKQLGDMKGSISEGVDTAAFVKTVVSEANKVGLRIKGLKPMGKKDLESYSEDSFDLSFSGAFVQVIVFLDRIVSADSIVRAENLKIRRIGSPVASIVEVEGQMQLKTFRYLGTRADDVAKKSSESTPIAPPVREAPAARTAPAAPSAPGADNAPKTQVTTPNAEAPSAPAAAPQAPAAPAAVAPVTPSAPKEEDQ